MGISQPHAHNVLKGVRNLSPEIFDLMLKYFHLSLLDLAPLEEIETQFQNRHTPERVPEVAFLAAPIGPGRPWPSGVNWRKSFPLPFPSAVVPTELFMAKLVADPAMTATLGFYDLALLDTSKDRRSTIYPHGLYIVERNGEAVLRYVRSGASSLYLLTDAALNNSSAWERLRPSPAHLSDVVKACVLWLGRERDRDALG